jgi:hypothetical protein
VLIDFLQLPTFRETLLIPETQPRAEGSFYMGWHDWLTSWRLTLAHDAHGLPAHASFELTVNFTGYENDPCPNLKLRGSSPVSLKSIRVQSDNFTPKPSSHGEVRTMIAPHFAQIRDWIEVAQPVAENGGERNTGTFTFLHPAQRRYSVST